MTTDDRFRLPRTVVPRRYGLELRPDLETGRTRGVVTISAVAFEPFMEVELNSAGLDIHEATIDGGTGPQTAEVTPKPGVERVHLRTATPLDAGDVEIRIAFSGSIGDDLRGLYRSPFVLPDGAPGTVVSTQLAPTEARRVFPCWDEPDAKAVFGLTLVLPSDVEVVANCPEVARTSAGGRHTRVTFADTPVISPYLVAFAFGDLEATEPVDVDGIPLRVVHTPGHGALTDFALEVGAFALRYFSEYYEVPFPAQKLDLVGIPEFAWGAMENLGAVMFRESALLVDPSRATQEELARVADVVAHEVAHQWFGDLVTMRWWNGIWLNEAFATFMEIKCVDAFRPEWKRWLSFAEARGHSMDIDALDSTRPVEYPVNSPDEALAMFDTLTYSKGAAVLRMLEQYLGEDMFRRGVVEYLRRYSFGNADTVDLWSALEAVSSEPVAEIMDTWIFQGGYPKLTVTVSETGHVVRQQPFQFLGESDGRWKVPLLYGDRGSTTRTIVGDEALLPAGDQLILNRGGHGFYRVHYSTELLEALSDRFEELEPLERHGVVSDAWATVLAGDVTVVEFLGLLRHLEKEMEPVVWTPALGGLAELDRIADGDTRERLRSFVRRLVAPVGDRLGWSPDPADDGPTRHLRGMLLRARGILGAELAVIERARVLAADDLSGRTAGDPDVVAAATAVAGAHGDLELFDRLMAAYDATRNPQQRVRYLRAALLVPDTAAVDRMLDAVATRAIKSQDAVSAIARLIGHREVGDAAWRTIRDRWDELMPAVPDHSRRYVVDLIWHRSDPEVAADIVAFLREQTLPGAGKHVEQQLERLEVRLQLRAREAVRLAEALEALSV